MAVSGQRKKMSFKDTIGRSSAEDGETFCNPCSSDGDWVVAVGYCQNCNEYFCPNCLKVHRKQSVTKNHVILEGGNMPKPTIASSIKLDACAELCDRHKIEILKFYCSSHDTVGCGDCMVFDHKACRVERIQDISTRYFNGPEHRELQRKVGDLCAELEQVTRKIRSNEKAINQNYSKVMNDIKVFRKEINDHLDRVEEELKAELKRRKRIHEELMSKLNKDEQSMRQEIEEMQGKLKLQASKANELFVSAKRINGMISSLDINIKDLIQSAHITHCAFHESPELKEVVAYNFPIGELKDKNIAEMKPEFDSEINVKTAKDERDSNICASALLSSSQIVLSDNNNKCVKIVAIDQRKVTARYELIQKPRDIAVASPTLIAVLLANENILFLSITQDNNINESHVIEAYGCKNIACQNEKVLAAGFGSVMIMNTSGLEQKKIILSDFRWPTAVAFGTEADTFYASYVSEKVVYKFTFDGNLVTKYQDTNLLGVRGLTVTRGGSVLVCNWAKNGSIHIISSDCKKIKEILQDNKHVKYPYCVSLCNSTNRLFLCNNEIKLDPQLMNVLTVFQMR